MRAFRRDYYIALYDNFKLKIVKKSYDKEQKFQQNVADCLIGGFEKSHNRIEEADRSDLFRSRQSSLERT